VKFPGWGDAATAQNQAALRRGRFRKAPGPLAVSFSCPRRERFAVFFNNAGTTTTGQVARFNTPFAVLPRTRS
jgi:hypothetical protein